MKDPNIHFFDIHLKRHDQVGIRPAFYQGIGRRYGTIQLAQARRPGPLGDGPCGDKCWECKVDGAIIGRALRPGEAAKRGQKWLEKIFYSMQLRD